MSKEKKKKYGSHSSYDAWEYSYFQYILDLHDIFTKNIDQFGIKGVNTANFIDVFSHFIYDCSSGEISPFLDKLPLHIENLYSEFDIKRNN